MKERIIEVITFILTILLIILIMFSSILVTYSVIKLRVYSIWLSIFGGISLILYIISKIFNFKYKKLELVLILMMIVSCLSLLNAVDINFAIFGKNNRREGLLVWLTYYIIALNCMNIKNEKFIKWIIYLIFIDAFINIFYGLFQTDILHTSLFPIMKSWHYARGFLGNSMYVGTLSSIFYGLVLGLFITDNKKIYKIIIYSILLIIASFSISFSGAMSSFFALIVLYLLLIILAIIRIIKKKPNRWRNLIFIVISIIVFSTVFVIYRSTNKYLAKDVKEFATETSSVSKGKIEESYGTARIYIWKRTIEKMASMPITGYGIDNFRAAFDSKLIDPTNGYIVDKAHNDYLQKMFCEGIYSGVIFITFLLIIFFKLIFKELSPVYTALFLAFTSYSIQAFFNISVIRVAPLYFIIIGLLIGRIYKKDDEEIVNKCQ